MLSDVKLMPNYRAIRGRTLFDCENGTVANNLIHNVVIGWGAFRLIAELESEDTTMGCDIHAHFEVKIDGEWLHYSQPRIERSYALFEKMAGVRGDVENAISPPKGLPSDLNKTTAFCAKREDDDSHSHSWLSSHEVVKLKEMIGRLDSDDFGYCFGNSWEDFWEYRDDYPIEVEDFRLVFWFDN